MALLERPLGDGDGGAARIPEHEGAMSETPTQVTIDAGELEERLRALCARFSEFRGRL